MPELTDDQIEDLVEVLREASSALIDGAPSSVRREARLVVDNWVSDLSGFDIEPTLVGATSSTEWRDRCARRVAANHDGIAETMAGFHVDGIYTAALTQEGTGRDTVGSVGYREPPLPAMSPERAADLFGPHKNPFSRPTGHPMQPVEMVGEVVRFKQNPIVRHLLDAGPFDLNYIAMNAKNRGWSDDDQSQLAQLIGYSVSGYGDLDYARTDHVQLADRIAQNILAITGPLRTE